mmetsp:Transcript_11469/g.30950  ORF Transcript_11469/g.30950 Transcript_11469/m.30950 type:complete len:303 (+) Transcript_11469:705-1613(+)
MLDGGRFTTLSGGSSSGLLSNGGIGALGGGCLAALCCGIRFATPCRIRSRSALVCSRHGTLRLRWRTTLGLRGCLTSWGGGSFASLGCSSWRTTLRVGCRGRHAALCCSTSVTALSGHTLTAFTRHTRSLGRSLGRTASTLLASGRTSHGTLSRRLWRYRLWPRRLFLLGRRRLGLRLRLRLVIFFALEESHNGLVVALLSLLQSSLPVLALQLEVHTGFHEHGYRLFHSRVRSVVDAGQTVPVNGILVCASFEECCHGGSVGLVCGVHEWCELHLVARIHGGPELNESLYRLHLAFTSSDV